MPGHLRWCVFQKHPLAGIPLWEWLGEKWEVALIAFGDRRDQQPQLWPTRVSPARECPAHFSGSLFLAGLHRELERLGYSSGLPSSLFS